MEENILYYDLMYKEMIKFNPAYMPAVFLERTEAKYGLDLDHLAHIRKIMLQKSVNAAPPTCYPPQ